MAKWFTRVSTRAAAVTGHYLAFAFAIAVVLVWAASGPLFGFSDTWQLVINTGTTIVTFLMVFLIQNTQNTENEAIQIKLDELIRAVEGAQNALLNLEDLSEAELDRIRSSYTELARRARAELWPDGKMPPQPGERLA